MYSRQKIKTVPNPCGLCEREPLITRINQMNGYLQYKVRCPSCVVSITRPTKFQALEEWNKLNEKP